MTGVVDGAKPTNRASHGDVSAGGVGACDGETTDAGGPDETALAGAAVPGADAALFRPSTNHRPATVNAASATHCHGFIRSAPVR